MNKKNQTSRKIQSWTKRRAFLLLAVLLVVSAITLAATAFMQSMLLGYTESRIVGESIQARYAADSGIDAVRLFLAYNRAARAENGGTISNPNVFQAIPVLQSKDPSNPCNYTLVAPGINEQGEYASVRFGLLNESAKLNLNVLPIIDSSQTLGMAGAMLGGGALAGGSSSGGGSAAAMMGAVSASGGGSGGASAASTPGRTLLMALPGMTEEIADAILDFIDADDQPREYGCERDYYIQLPNAYSPPNGPLESIEQLLLVRGVTPQLLFGLDQNRNGVLEASEANASLTQSTMQGTTTSANGTLSSPPPLGWAAYLTLYSREKNVMADGTPRINVNRSDDAATLQSDLAAAVGNDLATFIIAYRYLSDGNGGGGAGGGGAGGGPGGQPSGPTVPAVRPNPPGPQPTRFVSISRETYLGFAMLELTSPAMSLVSFQQGPGRPGQTGGRGQQGPGGPGGPGGGGAGGRGGQGPGGPGGGGAGGRGGQGPGGPGGGGAGGRGGQGPGNPGRPGGGQAGGRPGGGNGRGGNGPGQGGNGPGGNGPGGNGRGGNGRGNGQGGRGGPGGGLPGGLGGVGGTGGGAGQATGKATPWKADAMSGLNLDLSQPPSGKINQILDLIGASFTATVNGQEVSYQSPLSNSPIDMAIFLPTIMDKLTAVEATVLPGRININEAPREILEGLPGMTSEILEKLLEARSQNADTENRKFETWPMVEGIISLDQMKIIAPLLTGGGDVMRAHCVGYFEQSSGFARTEAVIDASGQVPTIVMYRKLDHLGRGFSQSTLGQRSMGLVSTTTK